MATEETHLEGRVLRKLQGDYLVQTPAGPYNCKISNKLRKELLYPTSDASSGTLRRVQAVEEIRQVDPVAIGDHVALVDAGHQTGVIREVLPRRNQLSRRAAGLEQREQIIAANVDQILMIIAAAQPSPRWHALDRMLVLAGLAGIPAVICLTKIDLKVKRDVWAMSDVYEGLGYPVLRTSVMDGRGVDALKATLQGKTTVLFGMSGVGKSSLLNAVEPELGLNVRQIRLAIDKGRHTTTHLEMFPLTLGGEVIDTPGIKIFGFHDLDPADLANYFPEMAPLQGQCKFRASCSHRQEPECAIRDAVTAGAINRERYASYVKMYDYISGQ
ncbi:MAG: ribosome small subunit-dependent GTPase A [Anaerolineales bacterium]|nr:ribosome small subunit-dependent GTPase A [Anaerolineales bacterium]